jgi:hypothetical protein
VGSQPNKARLLLPRLAAAFFVIVVGVLVALGVDGAASRVADRHLGEEYLERLLQDVEYDLRELDFIDASSRAGGEASRMLLSPDLVAAMEPSLLSATVLVVAQQRVPDLSRATFREIVSSGRIDLIESRAVRSALADYDRLILENEGFWPVLYSDLTRWAMSRVPAEVNARFVRSCVGDTEAEAFLVQTPCSFDLDGWSAEPLRPELGSPALTQQLVIVGNRYATVAIVAAQVRNGAGRLRQVLAEELSDA